MINHLSNFNWDVWEWTILMVFSLTICLSSGFIELTKTRKVFIWSWVSHLMKRKDMIKYSISLWWLMGTRIQWKSCRFSRPRKILTSMHAEFSSLRILILMILSTMSKCINKSYLSKKDLNWSKRDSWNQLTVKLMMNVRCSAQIWR